MKEPIPYPFWLATVAQPRFIAAPAPIAPPPQPNRAVRVEIDGVRYPSIQDAAVARGISPKGVRRLLKEGRAKIIPKKETP